MSVPGQRLKGNRLFHFVLSHIALSLLIMLVVAQPTYGYTAVIGTVTCKSGMVREGASTTSAFAFGVSKDEILTIVDEKKASDGQVWYQVSLNGQTGYIRSDLVKKSQEKPKTTENIKSTTNADATGGSAAYVKVGTVIKNSIRVREKASANSSMTAALIKDNTVTVLETANGDDGKKWYKVSFTLSDGTLSTGYVREDLLQISEKKITVANNDAQKTNEQTQNTQTKTAKEGTIRGTGIRVRSSASLNSQVIGGLNEGTVLTILNSAQADGKSWYQVKFSNGTGESEGFVCADYVNVTKTEASQKEGSQTLQTTNQTTITTTQIGKVKGAGVNIRKEPVNGSVICKLNSGASVTVTEQTGQSDGTIWYKISFIHQMMPQTGYIRSDFVEGITVAEKPKEEEKEAPKSVANSNSDKWTGAVRGINVNIRKEAVNGEVLCRLSTGHSVVILSEKVQSDTRKWYEISFQYNNQDMKGYICGDYLIAEAPVTKSVTEGNTVKTGAVKGTSVRVRQSAVNGSVLAQLDYGHRLTIDGEVTGSDGYVWYQISFEYQGAAKSGYIRSDYVNSITIVTDEQQKKSDEEFEKLIAQMPDSYKPKLRELHEKYPKWKIDPVDTGLDWNDVVKAECSVGKNLVAKSSIASWKSTEPQAYNWTDNSWYGFDGGNWASASKELIQYYLDPRNFLDDSGIFQFETLEYQDYQNEAGVSSILTSSFMNGSYQDTDGENRSYASTFVEAGKAAGISPYHLASRCLQEMGILGTSQSIAGNVAGLENLFNYFNIGAYAANGNTAPINGLIYAQGEEADYFRPWNTRYKSLMGSAKYVSEKYVKKGQNTLYFQKFNVVNAESGIYNHQYMSNILAASSESARMRKAYSDLNTSLVFKIPYYRNMPDTPAPKPTSESNPNSYLKELWIDNQNLSPEFSPALENYYLVVDRSVETINIGATPVSESSSVSGVGVNGLNVGQNVIQLTCKAQNGMSKTYTITVVRNE